jgi:hypothetical protein
VAVEVAYPNPIYLQPNTDMLLYSTGNEDPEWDRVVFFEEFEHLVNEVLHARLVFALIKSVNDDEKRSLSKSVFEKISFHDSEERIID